MSHDENSQVPAAAQPTGDLLGAIARGWCATENAGKEMDSDLAFAIGREVTAHLASQSQAAQPSKVMDERAMFEVKERKNSTNLDRREDGTYENFYTECAWEGWQARAHLAGQSQATRAVPDILFDGHAVYDEVMANDPHTPRPTADNIADVLDAVVRLIRRSAPTAQEATQQAAPECAMCNDSGIVGFPPDQYEECPDCIAARSVTQQAALTAPSDAVRIAKKQMTDPKLAGPGATAHERYLHVELEVLQRAVIRCSTASQPEPATAQQANVLPPFAAPASQHDWIAIGEHKPPEGVHVLVLYPNDKAEPYRIDQWVTDDEPESNVAANHEGWLSHYNEGITHWMPLPPTPDQMSTAGAAKGGTDNPNSSDLAPTTSTVSAPKEVRNQVDVEEVIDALRYSLEQAGTIAQDGLKPKQSSSDLRMQFKRIINVVRAGLSESALRTTSGKGEAA